MQRLKGANLVRQSVVLVCLLILNFCNWKVEAQSLPPAKPDGFVYENHRIDSDTILIEGFFDPVCPDTRDAWPPLKQVLHHYGHRVHFVVHLLPLPYHDHAFATSRALHIVNQLNPSLTFHLMESFFKIQERFYNSPTRNMSRASVVDDIVKVTAEAVGESYLSAVKSGFNDRKTDLLTRISFKYSATRGVSGTPTFFVNGFVLPDAGSPMDYNAWRRIIDPLVSDKGKEMEEPLHYFL